MGTGVERRVIAVLSLTLIGSCAGAALARIFGETLDLEPFVPVALATVAGAIIACAAGSRRLAASLPSFAVLPRVAVATDRSLPGDPRRVVRAVGSRLLRRVRRAGAVGTRHGRSDRAAAATGGRASTPLLFTLQWGQALLALVALSALVLGPHTLAAFVTHQLPRMASGEAFAFTEDNPDNNSIYSVASARSCGRAGRRSRRCSGRTARRSPGA